MTVFDDCFNFNKRLLKLIMVKKTIFGPTLVDLVFINRMKTYDKCFAEKLDNQKSSYTAFCLKHRKGKSAALFLFFFDDQNVQYEILCQYLTEPWTDCVTGLAYL